MRMISYNVHHILLNEQTHKKVELITKSTGESTDGPVRLSSQNIRLALVYSTMRSPTGQVIRKIRLNSRVWTLKD